MAAMIPEQGIGRAQVQGAGGEAETVAVPASTLRLFLHLLTEMSQTLRPRCRHVPTIRRPFAAGIQSGPMRPGRRGAAARGDGDPPPR